jgi:hypothetical protein
LSRRGWVLFATMSVIWGIPYLLIKVAVAGVPVPVLVLARVAIGAALLLSVLVLMKFTLFAFGTLVVVLVGIDLFWSGRCGTALAWAGAFGLGVVAVWMLIGQSPTNLPVYLLGAAEMVVGFADAMSLDGSSLEVGIAATVLFLLAATAISRSPWRSLQLSGVSSAALLFAGLGLFFKEGFVRHDQHACHFFAFALPATLIFPVALAGLDWRARWRRALLVLAGLLGAGGLIEVTRAYPNYLEAWPDPVGGIVEALPGLSDPAGLRRDLDARLEFLRSQQDLPRLRSVIGDDRVDVFGNFQAAVLLNRMNWHPRYGFQSYAAYTDRQSEQNAAFFDGPDAPLYVLANAWVIDGRFPPVEDGPALIRILAGYRPIAAERGFLLLRRTEGDARGARGALGTDRFVLRPKEVQDLPSTDRPLVLRLRARKSAWGALRSVLLRPPPLLLTVQASDGALLTHRVVPSLGGSGFLLSPLLREITDWVELYAVDGAPRRVLRLRLDAPSCESCYASFELEVDVLPALTSSRIDADQAASLRAQLRDP